MKFRLLHGAAIIDEKRPDGSVAEMLYRADPVTGVCPIIETDVDLEKRMNTPISRKFERIHQEGLSGHTWDPSKETIEQFAMRMRGVQPAQMPIVSQPPLGWTLEELEKYAAEEEITLEEAKSQAPQARPSSPHSAPQEATEAHVED